MSLAEARNWTPAQCRGLTLYQLNAMGIGAEGLQKRAKARAIHEQRDETKRGHAEAVLAWYAARGIDAR